MSDKGISVADIAAARNQKLAAEQQNTRKETDNIAQELEGAHQDALALKERLREQEGDSTVPQQQTFPHGSMASESKDQASMGEKVAEAIASTDQGVTTSARNAVHSASETVTAAGTAAANAVGAAVDNAKQALQSTLVTRAANAGGGFTTGYEGAVFSSDDPEYKDKTGDQPTIASPHEEVRFRGLASLLGGRSPVIATPKEPVAPGPPSLGEGSVGIAAGDPKGGANVVAAAHVASKGIVSSLKEAFTPTIMSAAAPAGPSDPDPRTAKVPVGDFRALHEALGIATPDGSHVGHAHHSSSSDHVISDTTSSADVSMGTTDQDNAAAMPSAQDVKQGWEGVKSQAQEGVRSTADTVQQGLESASEMVQGAVGADSTSTSSTGTGATGGGILSGLASIVSGIATKVNLANSSEELMAGGAVPDAAAGPAAADGPTAQVAPEATAAADAAADAAGDAAAKVRDAVTPDSSSGSVTESVKQGAQEVIDKTAYGAGAVTGGVVGAGERVADAAGSVRDSAAHTLGLAGGKADEAKQAAADTAADAKSSAAAAAGTAEDMAAAAKDKTVDAAASARDSTAHALGVAGGKADAAKESTVDAAASARDSASEAMAAAGGKVSHAAEQAKASAGGGLSSLIQGAKEGFVGAYDAAASVLVGDDDKHPHEPPSAAGGDSSGPPAAAHPPVNVAGDGGLQSGAVGSGHASVPHAGIGATLKQGWEDLKHGGAKAPHAVSTGGETAAAHDVTSNIERSKHLDNDQQAKIYKAETYTVSPGSQASSDQAGTDASKAGVMAGDQRPVTGAKPHGIPDSSKVHAGQATRFDGNKGMGTGFGTGSAAPWSGDTSIKHISALFSNTHSSLDMGGLNTQEQQALVEAAAQAGMSAERVDSTSEGGVRGWVSSMSAVWRHLGVASAKGPGEGGPSTKEIKDNIQWDNPTQDAVIDPVRGVTKKEGHSPGHKIQMRTSEQFPPDSDPSDPQFYKDKAERLGKVVKDSLTTSSEEAAADPNNLKGKSSDNKPDGLLHYTKHEAGVAADTLSHTPEAAVSAVGTAAEVVSGVAGHMLDKAKELGHNITQHGDFLNPEERTAKSKAAVERIEKQMEQMGDIATDHRAVQELQEERMANIGNPAHKRETLGDMIIGPMVKDASDDTNARKLAASYKEWQHDKEASAPGGQSSDSAGSGNSDSASMGADTAKAAQDMVKREGQAAGEGLQSAADKAGSKVGGAVESVKGLGSEAADTARATGEVISMEVSEATDAVKDKAHQATSRVSDATRDAKHSAQDTAQRTAEAARDVKHSAQGTAQDTADAARSTADRASTATKNAASRTGDSARDAGNTAADAANRAYGSVADVANRAGESVREGAAAVGDKVQQGVDAAAEGTGYVVGAGSEKMSDAQEAAARAGEKVGATAGGVLSSVGDAAKGLLGALLGPFEKEGAFDESTAALTGPPKGFEVVGAEQASDADMSSSQAPAVKRAPTTSSTAAAPAGADTDELRAKAAGALQDTKEGIKARVQAGIDDTARAAGLTAGHIESAVEIAQQQVHQQLAAVQDKVAAVTDNIQVPPAEIPANTEDLLRQRQQLQQ